MFACRLDQCPPGLFLAGGCLGFKSQYRTTTGWTEAFVVASGEYFSGNAGSSQEREALMVTPVEIVGAAALRLVSIDQE